MLNRNYRVECYSKDGFVVFMNECEAPCLESAVAIFIHELINIHDYDEDFDTDLAYEIINALHERFTVWYDTQCAEMGPTDKMYDFTILTVHLDS